MTYERCGFYENWDQMRAIDEKYAHCWFAVIHDNKAIHLKTNYWFFTYINHGDTVYVTNDYEISRKDDWAITMKNEINGENEKNHGM